MIDVIFYAVIGMILGIGILLILLKQLKRGPFESVAKVDYPEFKGGPNTPNVSVPKDKQDTEVKVINSDQLLKRTDLNRLEQRIGDLPRQVLDSITGSSSQHKGKLAELIAYIELKAQYDRMIPLNSIVDFICIRFPTATTPGTLDFIDIKNGKVARLSEDQKMLSDLIKNHQIQFLKIRIDTDVVKDTSGTDLPV